MGKLIVEVQGRQKKESKQDEGGHSLCGHVLSCLDYQKYCKTSGMSCVNGEESNGSDIGERKGKIV